MCRTVHLFRISTIRVTALDEQLKVVVSLDNQFKRKHIRIGNIDLMAYYFYS